MISTLLAGHHLEFRIFARSVISLDSADIAAAKCQQDATKSATRPKIPTLPFASLS